MPETVTHVDAEVMNDLFTILFKTDVTLGNLLRQRNPWGIVKAPKTVKHVVA